jgi:hypothetical protein
VNLRDDDACIFTLSPASQTVDSGGGLAPPIMVTATEGCSWTASEVVDRDWIAILEGSGTGNGQVVYSFDPNPGASSRKATLRIAGKTLVVTQLGIPPPDPVPPTVSFTTPADYSRQTNDTITVTGKAKDNVAVTQVEFRLENEAGVTDYFPTVGTENWSATFGGLIPGTNTIRVRAYDAENLPTEAVRSVVYVEVAPITVITNGEGSITPLRDGQFLDIGKDYMAVAKPARNHFFTHWSGAVESTANPLTFTMNTGFVLRGNFVFSPFFAAAGSYNGLFSEFENNRLESSGSISLKLAGLGGFSAKMMLGNQRLSFSGNFGLDGLATNEIVRAGNNTLTIYLALDLAGGAEQITGTISDGVWTSSVLAHRAGFNKTSNPAPQAGQYTWIVPGDDADAANQPGGDSFGTVTVDAAGNVKLTGLLADGTKVSQKAPLSKDGWWPLYVPLSGGGSLLSWVIFLDSSEASFTGVFTWIKAPRAAAKFYPDGFGLQRILSGSSYRPPTNGTDRVLTFTMGGVEFSAGNLAEPFENEVTLGDNNKVTNLGANPLKLTISPASGLFSGSVTPPNATRSLPFKGVLHQKGNYGSGFFLGTDESGRVKFSE